MALRSACMRASRRASGSPPSWRRRSMSQSSSLTPGGEGGGLPRVLPPAGRRTPAEVGRALPLVRTEQERHEDPFNWFTLFGSKTLGVGAILVLAGWLGYRQVKRAGGAGVAAEARAGVRAAFEEGLRVDLHGAVESACASGSARLFVRDMGSGGARGATVVLVAEDGAVRGRGRSGGGGGSGGGGSHAHTCTHTLHACEL